VRENKKERKKSNRVQSPCSLWWWSSKCIHMAPKKQFNYFLFLKIFVCVHQLNGATSYFDEIGIRGIEIHLHITEYEQRQIDQLLSECDEIKQEMKRKRRWAMKCWFFIFKKNQKWENETFDHHHHRLYSLYCLIAWSTFIRVIQNWTFCLIWNIEKKKDVSFFFVFLIEMI